MINLSPLNNTTVAESTLPAIPYFIIASLNYTICEVLVRVSVWAEKKLKEQVGAPAAERDLRSPALQLL